MAIRQTSHCTEKMVIKGIVAINQNTETHEALTA